MRHLSLFILCYIKLRQPKVLPTLKELGHQQFFGIIWQNEYDNRK